MTRKKNFVKNQIFDQNWSKMKNSYEYRIFDRNSIENKKLMRVADFRFWSKIKKNSYEYRIFDRISRSKTRGVTFNLRLDELWSTLSGNPRIAETCKCACMRFWNHQGSRKRFAPFAVLWLSYFLMLIEQNNPGSAKETFSCISR